jgi:hypothetical protein
VFNSVPTTTLWGQPHTDFFFSVGTDYGLPFLFSLLDRTRCNPLVSFIQIASS